MDFSIVRKIQTWVSDQRLIIDMDGCFNTSKDVTVFVTMSDVQNIQIDGAGDVYVRVNEELTVKIEGAGDVHYVGFPSIVNSTINGGGHLINEN